MIKDLKDLFVPYEQSLQLKELGFDEPCFGIWIGRGSKYDVMYVAKQEDAWMAEQNDGILAPIFAQAFEFFREKYNLKSWVQELTNGNFLYQIRPHNLTDYKEGEVYAFEIHREAELACLIKLIEITKNKQ